MMMFTFLLILLLSSSESTCPQSQRYDITSFPPRCLACPKIVSNAMNLSRIVPQTLRTSRTPKFSPGLPQNQTCGCWSAANQTVEVGLNASWIVAGLVLGSQRTLWWREFGVAVSDDNMTYLDWGNYTANNYTSSVAFFSYPVKARYFRITIYKYANHYINVTTGVPISVQALVSSTQPFSCVCPTLLSGECCPYDNMRIINNTCVWCMDPGLITTVMVNGCGECKAGTFEYNGRCVYSVKTAAGNSFAVGNVSSDGVAWSAAINFTAVDDMWVFVANHTVANALDYVLFAKPVLWSLQNKTIQISPQFVQFDRGRYLLSMSEITVRSWASCKEGNLCTGYVGALFTMDRTRIVSAVTYPLVFKLTIPNFVCVLAGQQYTGEARAELHDYAGVYVVRIIGLDLNASAIVAKFDEADYWSPAPNFILPSPPPLKWNSLYVRDEVTSLQISQPVTIVHHSAVTQSQYTGINVTIAYGFGFSPEPSPGDTDQIITITAQSSQPIRLKSMSTRCMGVETFYTNSKGFITDFARVLDLSIACVTGNAIVSWLSQALRLLPDSSQQDFIRKSCSLQANRAYWLVPQPVAGRTDSVGIDVMAEFV
jgi:hypothetical protein